MSSVTQSGPIHLGLDVHKDSISVAVLPWGQDTAEVDKIFHDEPSVRRLVARFADPAQLRVCYEAGPTGYELQRLLASMRVRCDVVAPSLIPRAPGDRVKTDRRDARRLARLPGAGERVNRPGIDGASTEPGAVQRASNGCSTGPACWPGSWAVPVSSSLRPCNTRLNDR